MYNSRKKIVLVSAASCLTLGVFAVASWAIIDSGNKNPRGDAFATSIANATTSLGQNGDGAFQIDESQLKMSGNNLDLTQIQIDTSSLPELNIEDLLKDIDINFKQEDIQKLSQDILSHFKEYMKNNGLTDPTHMQEYFIAYLQSQDTQSFIQNKIMSLLQESGLTEQFETNIKTQMQSLISQYTQSISTQLQQQISSQISNQMSDFASKFQQALTIDESKIKNAFKMNMNEEELSELMMSLMSKDTSSYDTNLKKLQYADEKEPSIISIYPIDFESKEEIIHILDQYNENVKEEQVITYTDYVGTLMSSVTDIINVISYVLVAFVAISLVVSSIMIGVITYISVLERKKEIGILRAIGASKHNVSQVFNAETFIIGLLAGLIGIGVTLLLLIPSNMVIHSIAGTNDINASLPIVGGIVLVLLSVILTLLGGIIPSRKAAKEDPVTALRTE